MNRAATRYVWGVIAVGTAVLAASLAVWRPDPSLLWLLYLAGAVAASAVKLRLPGNEGSYSLAFAPALYGIMRFQPAETLLVCCAASIGQSVLNTNSRPKWIQLMFNAANISLSAGICYLVAWSLPGTSLGSSAEAVLCAVACTYFAVNTLLVSEVLALLEGKQIREINRKWYLWSFPVYLVGVALVGLATRKSSTQQGEACLVLLPLGYLVHFFLGLASRRRFGAPGTVDDTSSMPAAARLYINGVLAGGLAMLAMAMSGWNVADERRFLAYLALSMITATMKVPLPGMTSTLSLNHVILLVAISQLSLGEAVFAAAAGAVVQTVWRSQRILLEQVLFNASTLAMGAGLAHYICRIALAPWLSESLAASLVLSTVILYMLNTLLVAIVLCLVNRRPLRMLWGACHFWTFPYYLVGAAVAGLIVAVGQTSGWMSPLLMLTAMAMLHISYRAHVVPATR